ncbi:hypothetical protein ACNTMW_13190 [Planosporangium sp. 12N6]|uniref:hypothetical protein n=1 Tax=Planosporangium spinosum TaxID=3402278 RepID=UPI003CF7D056
MTVDRAPEVTVDARIRPFGELHIGGSGPVVTAAFAYLLIVGAATGAAAVLARGGRGADNAVAGAAVFISVLVLGVWGSTRLKS